MTFTLSFKDVLDKPTWRQVAYAQTVQAAGKPICCDFRNSVQRDSNIYYLSLANILEYYNTTADEWFSINSSIGSGIGAGANIVYAATGSSAFGVAAAPAAANITLAALPTAATVGLNQLANRGDGRGFYIRVIDNGAGGSGKTEVRQIIANTASTTPVVYFDTPLSFVPVANSHYELLGGVVYIWGSGSGAGNWKKLEVATKTISGNLNTTNAPGGGTDAFMLVLDELYVPYDRNPGEGFLIGAGTYNGGLLGCLTATATAAGTITGQAAAGDAAVLINEYRNFQIRIVEDTGTPTAAGQRRKITSHTAGASPVYTLLTNWTVQPSATAKFVIENNNDLLMWGSNLSTTWSYAAGGFQADANWSTSGAAGGAIQYADSPVSSGAGTMNFSCFSVEPDVTKIRRQSHICKFRNGSSSLYYFDIAAGANGVWSATITAVGQQTHTSTIGTGSCGVHDPVTNQGRYAYYCLSGTGRIYRIDLMTFVTEPWSFMSFPQGTAHVGQRMAMEYAIDGTSKLGFLFHMTMSDKYCFDIALQR